ncbi:MAG: BlaI/MecI/CopY family transcriptional regulator [Pseudobdellovibrio sp.]
MARPSQPGLTENELDVMKVLWKEAPLKVSEILEKLTRKTKPAYTSLLTLVQAMESKGYIAHEQDGKAYTYFPKLEQQSFTNNEIKRVAERLFNNSPFALAVNLVKDEHLSPEEIQQLRQMLELK